MAANLVQSKLWSQKRGMDRVGVDDPETESDIIRAERTDASMFPADVATMAQLMTVLQSLGYGAPPAAEEAMGQQSQSLAGMRAELGGREGVPSMNAPEEQPLVPPEGQPANVPAGAEAQGVVRTRGGHSQPDHGAGRRVQGRLLTDTEIPPGG